MVSPIKSNPNRTHLFDELINICDICENKYTKNRFSVSCFEGNIFICSNNCMRSFKQQDIFKSLNSKKEIQITRKND